MRAGHIFLIAMSALPIAVAHADTASRWNFAYNNGIGEYSTGIWDATRGAALSLSCRDRTATVMAQIKGKAPPPHSRLLLTIATRDGTSPMPIPTDATGSAEFPVTSPDFAKLWAALRGGDIVTVSYDDGQSSVLSLDGAAATLPDQPCR